MIESFQNIFKFAYKSQQKNERRKHNYKKQDYRRKKQIFTPNIEMQDLCKLIESEEPIDYWITNFQLYKDNFYIKSCVYNGAFNKKVTLHNLFVMMIQCKIFPSQVWIGIEKLCQLNGARDNELCCLIHYIVTNMGTEFQLNPLKWNDAKANQELNKSFCSRFLNIENLSQKVTILPMILVLNRKNSKVLWEKLGWLSYLAQDIINDFEANLSKLLHPDMIQAHEFLLELESSSFLRLMHKKSLILIEIQGFVSGKNLFSYSYELYNIPLLLEVLANSSITASLADFITEFLYCCHVYQFDLTKVPRDFNHLITIIIERELYFEELANISLLRDIEKTVSFSLKEKLPISSSLAKLIPRCSIKPNKIAVEPEIHNKDKMMRRVQGDTILSYIVNQVYELKTGYLKIIKQIMEHCYAIQQEPWAAVNSHYYKLQFLLYNFGFLSFLIEQYTAIQSNDLETMISYFDCFGYMLRSNPIMYGYVDQILLEFENQKTISLRKKKRNQSIAFQESFLKNIVASRKCIQIVLCDQISWYDSIETKNQPKLFFISETINELESEWMSSLTLRVIPSLEHTSQEYQWVTFFISFYYYFFQLSFHDKSRSTKEVFLDNLMMNGRSKIDSLFGIMDQWEKYYEGHLKNSIIQYGLSYPILKEQKKCIIKKIQRYIKLKEFETQQLPFIIDSNIY